MGFAAPALAADLGGKIVQTSVAPVVVSPWDLAFGAAIMSDYNFRGISQSDRGPAVSAYFEPRFNINPNLQLYVGLAGSSVKLPTDPSAEIDFYGGIRPTFGALALDFGFIYYYYPEERQIDGIIITAPPSGNTTLTQTDFWEVYGKASYTLNEIVTLGANVYYTPSWLNSGADGVYLAGTAKLTAPGTIFQSAVGAYVSGEFGHQSLGTTKIDPVAFPVPWQLPDYNYWNLGAAFTYKALTLDFRYHDTDLSKEECNVLTADPGATLGGTIIPITNAAGAQSKWCGSAFIVKLSVDSSLLALK